MKWRVDARAERRADRRGASALLRQMERYAVERRLPPPAPRRSISATATHRTAAAPATTASTSSSRRRDPVVLARKILSCVVRVGQRFGATHVASVLRGHASEQVVARRHQTLSTFGLLPEVSVAEVRGYIEQLVGLDLLRVERRRISGARRDRERHRAAQERAAAIPV